MLGKGTLKSKRGSFSIRGWEIANSYHRTRIFQNLVSSHGLLKVTVVIHKLPIVL